MFPFQLIFIMSRFTQRIILNRILTRLRCRHGACSPAISPCVRMTSIA